MIDTSPDVDLVARYAELKTDEEQALKAGKVARREIVAELKERHGTREAAYMLGISVSRVGQIMRGEDSDGAK